MSLWLKLRGTIETAFQIGLGGPQVKNNAGALEARNAGDSAFAIARGASPVGDSDLATKQYVDTIASPTIVTAQANGGSALPANTGVEHFIVVSTSGVNAAIGQLLWDDGSSVGTVTVLAAAARMIVPTVALSGGTVTFSADTPYIWDVAGSAWVNAGPSGFSGAVREIRFAITNAASQSSAKAIPANAIVKTRDVTVTTPFSAGATIAVGQTGTPALLQATTDNLPQGAANSTYEVADEVAWGAAALAVLVTVGGAPAAGAGFVSVFYSLPDA
jgi:hypothetical protein